MNAQLLLRLDVSLKTFMAGAKLCACYIHGMYLLQRQLLRSLEDFFSVFSCACIHHQKFKFNEKIFTTKPSHYLQHLHLTASGLVKGLLLLFRRQFGF